MFAVIQRFGLVFAAILLTVLLVAACNESTEPSSAGREQAARNAGYDTLVRNQPAVTMKYSPTRETIRTWIRTWDKPGKLAYVYFQNANGDFLGYYVFKGPPVSMCAALTPTQSVLRSKEGGFAVTNAPGVDGAYYSGGQCNTEYGVDAETGAVLQYTVGLGINVLVYSEPLKGISAPPLGDARTG